MLLIAWPSVRERGQDFGNCFRSVLINSFHYRSLMSIVKLVSWMCVEFSVNVTTLQNKAAKYSENEYAMVRVHQDLKSRQLQLILDVYLTKMDLSQGLWVRSAQWPKLGEGGWLLRAAQLDEAANQLERLGFCLATLAAKSKRKQSQSSCFSASRSLQ